MEQNIETQQCDTVSLATAIEFWMERCIEAVTLPPKERRNYLSMEDALDSFKAFAFEQFVSEPLDAAMKLETAIYTLNKKVGPRKDLKLNAYGEQCRLAFASMEIAKEDSSGIATPGSIPRRFE